MDNSIAEVADIIASRAPKEFLAAVRETGGRFLYRGDEPSACDPDRNILIPYTNDLVVRTCDPLPDLLLVETYGSEAARSRFEALEDFLSTSSTIPIAVKQGGLAKPSNGHLATSDPKEAARWGSVVSVWPLLPEGADAGFSYVWPRDRRVFYDEADSAAAPRDSRRVLAINEHLPKALTAPGGREVLFATVGGTTATTTTAFLAVPIELDDRLRTALETIGYGLQ